MYIYIYIYISLETVVSYHSQYFLLQFSNIYSKKSLTYIMQYKYKNINSEVHRLSLNLLEGFNKMFRLNQTFSMSKKFFYPQGQWKRKG